CPSPDLCFSLNVPDVSISSGSGELYLQITGASSYSWVGIAQGESMAGAHYFVMYTSGDSTNVTVSTRVADGHSMPTFNPSTTIELLEGSGIENGIMTANIHCRCPSSNCGSWNGGSMDLTARSTNWIWAHRSGDAINSDDASATIVEHDLYGTLTFDASAHGGSSTNPFLSLSSSTPTIAPPTSTGSVTTSSGPPPRIVRLYTAHAILACFAWASIFPIGGIMIRLLSFPHLLWLHAGLQIFGFCIYTAAVGLGIKLAVNPLFWRLGNKHVVIGLVVFIMFFVQGFAGYAHHLLFKKYQKRTLFSYFHLWSGRLCVTLGMINAGFGFQITRKGFSNWEVITYTVFAVTIWVTYVVSIVVGESRRRKS
ncbi:iron reductase domain protein, partial [Melanomma pulvis-pyrius CBS 109.77]